MQIIPSVLLALGLASTSAPALPSDSSVLDVRATCPTCFGLIVFTYEPPLCVTVLSGNLPIDTSTLLAGGTSLTSADDGKCFNAKKPSQSYNFLPVGQIPSGCKLQVYTTLGCKNSNFDSVNVADNLVKCQNKPSIPGQGVQSFKLVCPK